MNIIRDKSLWIICTVLLLSACSSVKNIPENDALFTGSKIDIIETPLLPKDKKNVLDELQVLPVPRPNKKFLWMPFKLWMHNLGSEKGIGKWIRNKFGEPPVLLSQVNENLNSQILDNYLENRGFFRVRVDNEIIKKGKKAYIKYEIFTGPEYRVRDISFPKDSGELAEAIRATESGTLLKSGTPFNLNTIIAERTRINTVLKDKGYYFFNDDYLLLESDTTIGNNEVAMYLTIKKITPEEAKHPYKIKSVVIYPNYELSNNRQEVDSTSIQVGERFVIIDSTQIFKPIIFESAMQFRPGDLYSRKNHNATLSRL
nr:hypothetical protein [Saprospiraceae bacterium]